MDLSAQRTVAFGDTVAIVGGRTGAAGTAREDRVFVYAPPPIDSWTQVGTTHVKKNWPIAGIVSKRNFPGCG